MPISTNDLVEVVRQGSAADVESQWMELFSASETPPSRLAASASVLSELVKKGQGELAATLAWEGIETIRSRMAPRELISVAGPLLQAVGDNAELRNLVADLYVAAFPSAEGLEALLKEAGIRSGRPVRRAVRTLEVCAELAPGDFLAARDEDTAARVEAIDRSAWEITIATPEGSESVEAVLLADRFAPAAPTDFRILRVFDREHLAQRIRTDPGAIVVELCRQRGDELDSETLEHLLVPDFIEESGWKKWWTQARTALKRYPNVTVDGRSPCVVHYVHSPATLEDELSQRFQKERDPVAQLDVVERYLRDCKLRKEELNQSALRECYDRVFDRASQTTHAAHAVLLWTIARRIGEAAGAPDAANGLIELVKEEKDFPSLLASMDDDRLLETVCMTIFDARSADGHGQLLSLLPRLPLNVCDTVANRLIRSGCSPAEFAPAVQQILSAPVPHFEALLWLWDGPTHIEILGAITPAAVFTRILRALDDCRRNLGLSKDLEKRCYARARSVLSARKYERFRGLVESIEAGMASAFRNQLSPLDGLGRAVREDLTNLLLDRFPAPESKPKAPIWAREDIVFVTEYGLKKRQEEIDLHVNVKMRENAKAIGAAAEKGDLSENSEYKFALEERDLLQARLIQMNTEMAMARVLRMEEVPTDHVGVGTHVVFRRATDGQRYDLAFVGPWDTDPAKGWINYKSPLAQLLMGKHVGDRVEFDHSGATGSYDIVELRNALAD